jgi:hypothetical protein
MIAWRKESLFFVLLPLGVQDRYRKPRSSFPAYRTCSAAFAAAAHSLPGAESRLKYSPEFGAENKDVARGSLVYRGAAKCVWTPLPPGLYPCSIVIARGYHDARGDTPHGDQAITCSPRFRKELGEPVFTDALLED